MRHLTLLILCLAATTFGQTGRITGSVVDEAGAPIQGARVTAALWSRPQPAQPVPGRPPAFLPVPAKALSGEKGEFTIEGLLAGQYYICVDKPEQAILNPCLWADPPPRIEVGEGAAVTGVATVAGRGVTIDVRVHDPKGLLRVNPAQDDVRIGTYHRASLFIPARITDRDPAGRTMSVIVPRGRPASIAVSSASFVLSDDKGAALASAVPVAADAVAKPGAGPILTVHVTAAKPK